MTRGAQQALRPHAFAALRVRALCPAAFAAR